MCFANDLLPGAQHVISVRAICPFIRDTQIASHTFRIFRALVVTTCALMVIRFDMVSFWLAHITHVVDQVASVGVA